LFTSRFQDQSDADAAAVPALLADTWDLQLVLDDIAQLGIQHSKGLANTVLLQKLLQACRMGIELGWQQRHTQDAQGLTAEDYMMLHFCTMMILVTSCVSVPLPAVL
jgi:hypothetical protein